MEFRILGLLDVVEDGGASISVTKQRALLAALPSGRTSRLEDALVDDLWGATPRGQRRKRSRRTSRGSGRLSPAPRESRQGRRSRRAATAVCCACPSCSTPPSFKAASRRDGRRRALRRNPGGRAAARCPGAPARSCTRRPGVRVVRQAGDCPPRGAPAHSDRRAGRRGPRARRDDELIGELEVLAERHPLRERLRGRSRWRSTAPVARRGPSRSAGRAVSTSRSSSGRTGRGAPALERQILEQDPEAERDPADSPADRAGPRWRDPTQLDSRPRRTRRGGRGRGNGASRRASPSRRPPARWCSIRETGAARANDPFGTGPSSIAGRGQRLGARRRRQERGRITPRRTTSGASSARRRGRPNRCRGRRAGSATGLAGTSAKAPRACRGSTPARGSSRTRSTSRRRQGVTQWGSEASAGRNWR